MTLQNIYKLQKNQNFIQDHKLNGKEVLAATMQLELAALTFELELTQSRFIFENVRFLKPGLFNNNEALEVQVEGSSTEFKISANCEVICRGKLQLDTVTTLSPTFVPSPVNNSFDIEKVYREWDKSGISYGLQYRTITKLDIGNYSAQATIAKLNDNVPWCLNPLLLDGAIQAASSFINAKEEYPAANIPAYIERLIVHPEFKTITQAKVYIQLRPEKKGVDGNQMDILITDLKEKALVTMEGIRLVHLSSKVTENKVEEMAPISIMEWCAVDLDEKQELVSKHSLGRWILVAPQVKLERLSKDMREIGVNSIIEFAIDTLMESATTLPNQQIFEQQLQDMISLYKEIDGIIYSPFSMEQSSYGASMGSVMGLVSIIKILVSMHELELTSLIVLTESAQKINANDKEILPERTALWGAFRTACNEYPNRPLHIIDIEPEKKDASIKLVISRSKELPHTVAIRNGDFYRPMMVPKNLRRAKPFVRPHGRYLITGGLGGIGSELAKRLLAEGAEEVLLLTRSKSYNQVELLPGTRIISADLTCRGDLARGLAKANIMPMSIQGVFHAAGSLKDSLICNTTYTDIATVMGPKVCGAIEIEETFSGANLDYIVAFASVSGLFGNVGQVSYSAANSFFDGLAMCSEDWISIDWGLWGQIGMGVKLADKLAKTGFKSLETNEAFNSMWAMLASDCRHAVLAKDIINQDLFGNSDEQKKIRANKFNEDCQLKTSLEKKILNFVKNYLGLSVLSMEDSLSRYGMSSIISTEMAEKLSNELNQQLPLTLFLEYDTVCDITEALKKMLPERQINKLTQDVIENSSFSTNNTVSLSTTNKDKEENLQVLNNNMERDIAIVGLSAAMPGSKNLNGFWELIRNGKNGFTTVPNSRFNIDDFLKNETKNDPVISCKLGAFLDELEPNVATLAKVSKREYLEMDPQQKLMLFHANEALKQVSSAGHTVGVYIAATYSHQRDRSELSKVTPYSAIGTMNAFLANRISHALNLTGPSQTIDTLCSSSLVALQQAVEDLRHGHCTTAIVGACNVGLTDWYYRSLSQLGALATNHLKPFDIKAEGFIPGEGVVAVVLKQLKEAQRDNNQILGVIKGIATGHNGGRGALTVPICEAQVRVIESAIKDANLNILDIDYFETHGTGTKLGDPIEIAALNSVVDKNCLNNKKKWFIGATKGNVGHQEPVAGLTSLTKVLLCFKHQTFPPIAGLEKLNPNLEQYCNHFIFPTSPQSWECASGIRRAGISAFGMGGTNAHVIIEEYTPFNPYEKRNDIIDMKSIIEAHRIQGKPVVPAALSLQYLFKSAEALTDIKFLRKGMENTQLSCQTIDDILCVLQGSAILATAIPHINNQISIFRQPPVKEDLRQYIHEEELYEWYASNNMDFGKPLRILSEISFTKNRVSAKLDKKATRTAVIDAVFQICGVLTLINSPTDGTPLIPKKIKFAYMNSHTEIPEQVEVWSENESTSNISKFSGHILDSNEMPVYKFEDIEFISWSNTGGSTEHKVISNNIIEKKINQVGSNNQRTIEKSDIDEVLEIIRNTFQDSTIESDTNLLSAGMDSILASEIAQHLNKLGWKVIPTTVLSARNVKSLVYSIGLKNKSNISSLDYEVQDILDKEISPENLDSIQMDGCLKSIDIFGMAYRLPYKKSDGNFWETLKNKHTAFLNSPDNRNAIKHQKSAHFRGAFIESASYMDINLFEVSPHVADVMDPQMRLLLETVWEVMEDAGINPLGGHKNIGVFIGASYNHYKDAFLSPDLDSYSGLGNQNAFLANRVSYFFDCTGPSMTIDTLCSSSLVALHQAVQSLRNYECDQAIVAGVHIDMSHLYFQMGSRLRAFSHRGELLAFDADADGFVPGEGVVVLILRRTGEGDNAQVKAVIKGTAVNHGGRSAGLTVPSSDAQAAVISAALKDAGVNAKEIGLVEAHGTGTVLGDPIEIEGLKKAWSSMEEQRQVCGLGSVKSNIGHLEPAAGLAGIVKVILAMKEKTLPPTVGVSRPNNHIAFENTPFFLVERPMPWPESRPLAGVSAFGMGGVNAHVIIGPGSEETKVERRGKIEQPFVCKVSAATETALRSLADLYAQELEDCSDWKATDFCFTANTVRATLSYIGVASATTVKGLIKELRKMATGESRIMEVKDEITVLEGEVKIDEVIERACNGTKFPPDIWRQLSPPDARIISIPTYPFEKLFHWINTELVIKTFSWEEQPLIKKKESLKIDYSMMQDNTVLYLRKVWLSPRILEHWREDLQEIFYHNNFELIDSPEQAEIIISQYMLSDELENLWNEIAELSRRVKAGMKMVLICQGLYKHLKYNSYDQRQIAIGVGAAVAWRSLAAEINGTALIIDSEDGISNDLMIERILGDIDSDNVSLAVSWVKDTRYVLKYKDKKFSEQVNIMPSVKPDQYWVVIGGNGSIGIEFSRFLLENGYDVIAIGRSRIPSKEFQELSLCFGKNHIVYRSADARNFHELLMQCSPIDNKGVLVGIINAAGGETRISSIFSKKWKQVKSLIDTKIFTSENAIEVAKALKAQYAILTSSLAAVDTEAGKGLADYAVANAAQATLAMLNMHDDNLKVIAHFWPNWSGVGLDTNSKYAKQHSLSINEATSYFANTLTESGVFIIQGHSEKSIISNSENKEEESSVKNDDLVVKNDLIKQAIYSVLGEVDNLRPFSTMGLNSLMIADLVSAIEEKANILVHPSIFFEQHNINELIRALICGKKGSVIEEVVIDNNLDNSISLAEKLIKVLSQRKEIINE